MCLVKIGVLPKMVYSNTNYFVFKHKNCQIAAKNCDLADLVPSPILQRWERGALGVKVVCAVCEAGRMGGRPGDRPRLFDKCRA